jgi:hypothetical protein
MLGSSAEFIMFMERTSNYRYKPGTANRPFFGELNRPLKQAENAGFSARFLTPFFGGVKLPAES